jgi:hypothetical protein
MSDMEAATTATAPDAPEVERIAHDGHRPRPASEARFLGREDDLRRP